MKKFILSLIALFILVICLAPFIDGYFFKKTYYQQVAMLQQEMQQANYDDRLQIKIESYDLGWLQSIAYLKIIITNPRDAARPISFNIKSIIHHGPLVTFQEKLQLGSASIESFIYLPDIFSKSLKNDLMQVATFVPLDRETWTNYYDIAARSVKGIGFWEGLSGTTIVKTKNDRIVEITTHVVLKKLSLASPNAHEPQVTIMPITGDSKLIRQLDLRSWDVAINISVPMMILKRNNDHLFSVSQLMANAKYGLHDQLYNYNSGLSIEKIQLLPSPFFVRDFSKVFFTLAIHDLHFGDENLQKYKQWMTQGIDFRPLNPNELLPVLVPSSKMIVDGGVNTELGAVSTHLSVAFLSLPKTTQEILSKILVDFKIQISQALLEKLFSYFEESSMHQAVTQSSTSSGSPTQGKAILNMMIQKKYILQNKNDYILSFKIQGPMISLNNRPSQSIDATLAQLDDDFKKVLMPPSVTPAPASVSSTSPYRCYWMDSSSGKNIWVMTSYDNVTCYRMDSCNGGLHQSGGGCYKWAASIEAEGLPWNTPVPATPVPSAPTPVSNASPYRCYWMDSSSGKNIWVMTSYDNVTCYRMDSCNGGLHQSGGGCYKWAASIEAAGVPWSIPNNTPAITQPAQ